MKRVLISFIAMLAIGSAVMAQPAKTRISTTANSAQKKQAASASANDRFTLQFPSSASMPEDVVWKRDLYRQLDLMKDKNAPMYYPVEPVGRQVNLFTYLFRLVLTGRVQAYAYKLDGNESFEEKDKLDVKSLLENHKIYYEEKDGKLTVTDSDIPSAEVKRFYVKESVYFDQRTSTFSTRVTALCPVRMESDEYSAETTPYPLFWLKYDDVATWLAKLPMMGSNLNNVSNLTAADFFTLNHYEGKIYKTNNLQGRVLANYCTNDSDMVKEQKRIEKQLTDFEAGVWGHVTDSAKLDSLKKAEAMKLENKKGNKHTASPTSRRRTSSTSGNSEKSASSTPRVSARRQRR